MRAASFSTPSFRQRPSCQCRNWLHCWCKRRVSGWQSRAFTTPLNEKPAFERLRCRHLGFALHLDRDGHAVIGSNLARRHFSLAGALAIIRFPNRGRRHPRHGIRDCRGCDRNGRRRRIHLRGAGRVPVLAVTAWVLTLWAGRPPAGAAASGVKHEPGSLVIRMGNWDESRCCVEGNARPAPGYAGVVGSCDGPARNGPRTDLHAMLKPAASAIALIAELNKIEGVQSVEWKT